MRKLPVVLLMLPLALACASRSDRQTLAELRDVEPDLREVKVEDSLERAVAAYRDFLEQAPESSLTPEAMRRLADLRIEKEYGILGGEPRELPAPESASTTPRRSEAPRARTAPAAPADSWEEVEQRARGEQRLHGDPAAPLEGPGGEKSAGSGPAEALALYDRILSSYPDYEHSDQILYQKARALDELGRNDEAIGVIEEMIQRFPGSRFVDEVQFRRGEYFFVRRKYLDAEGAYAAVVRQGPVSEYYELALYKLGWSFYKQFLHEEAVDQYVALLDYKVSTGYDFDQTADEGDERRIADTFRVLSLGFSELGGPDTVRAYFASAGERSYEDRVYSHLGEFYFEKLRYQDAAASYQAFVDLHPFHGSAPRFVMRTVEIYDAGGFPRLVLESKKAFAAGYGLQAEYWRHVPVADAPEVVAYLKTNLQDLASHYHAVYQEDDREKERPQHFAEALRWYREYLASFSEDPEAPVTHFRMADLMLEYGDFGLAAREYEHTAYEYPPHERSADAGYAAIFAHREHLEQEKDAVEAEQVRADAVASTLRFVDAHPGHERAAAVLGAAVDDLYAMRDFERTLAYGQRLIETYPDADPLVRRAAWGAMAHASLDTADYVAAESAYGRVLEMTPGDDESRQDVIDNLAAAIYKQGEQANRLGDHRAAADHFLRIPRVAPTSAVRAAAEYDAGAALIALEDWDAAATVLEAFRETHPDNDLQKEATKQIARIHREQGDLAGAAREYERVASEADDPKLRREALLLAGSHYADTGLTERALAVYASYVEQFPEPLELSLETRWKIAELHRTTSDESARRKQLDRIVKLAAAAGDQETPLVRTLAARSALALTERAYQRFAEVRLVQPFEKHLEQKQRRMNAALEAFTKLVDYEVGEVTAAATYYMAEIYFEFSAALLDSERPGDLTPDQLTDYELVLEEEAFPFEEKAIDVHQKNLELMAAGVYNAWIEKSLGRLGVMMPGRYAKHEISAGPVASLDHYAYRAPALPAPAPEAGEEPASPESDPPPASPAPDAPDAEIDSADADPSVRG